MSFYNRFECPATVDVISFNSDIPEDMTECFEKWRSYTINQKD